MTGQGQRVARPQDLMSRSGCGPLHTPRLRGDVFILEGEIRGSLFVARNRCAGRRRQPTSGKTRPHQFRKASVRPCRRPVLDCVRQPGRKSYFMAVWRLPSRVRHRLLPKTRRGQHKQRSKRKPMSSLHNRDGIFLHPRSMDGNTKAFASYSWQKPPYALLPTPFRQSVLKAAHNCSLTAFSDWPRVDPGRVGALTNSIYTTPLTTLSLSPCAPSPSRLAFQQLSTQTRLKPYNLVAKGMCWC